MSKTNSSRTGCKDVFRAFLVEKAFYDGTLEIPVIRPVDYSPNKVIPFSKAMSSTDYNQWIHFYEDDVNFERIWNNPKRYLEKLRKFMGIITPDFSLYRDMPLVMQQWNTYRGKALGAWWQENGLRVIPNVRFSDERSYEFCCNGVPACSTISIGSHGCIKLRTERDFFQKGLAVVIEKLKPKRIIVYGSAPDDIFSSYKQLGIEILQFSSEFACSRKAVTR